MSDIRDTHLVTTASDMGDLLRIPRGADVRENLYIRMPPGLPSRSNANGDMLIVKLRTSLYGLRQVGREWANLLCDFLTE